MIFSFAGWLTSCRNFQLAIAPALAIAAICLPWHTARAELLWADKSLELKADAKTPVVEGHFHFTNPGPGAVDIRNIESSCGCTTTELAKRHYESGESGDIVAKYTVGINTGLQKKTILVSATGQKEATLLALVVDVPQVVRFAPTYVTWGHGEARTTKQITMDVVQDEAPSAVNVQSSLPTVAVEVRTLAKGRRYQFDITPSQTDHVLVATLTIHCHYGDDDKTFRVYATVKPAELSR